MAVVRAFASLGLAWSARGIGVGVGTAIALPAMAAQVAAAPPAAATTSGSATVVVTGRRPQRIGDDRSVPRCADQHDAHASASACAAARLDRVARDAQARAQAGVTADVPDARSGDVRVGVGSLTAANQRYATDLRGASALPRRPVVPRPAASPVGR